MTHLTWAIKVSEAPQLLAHLKSKVHLHETKSLHVGMLF